MGVGRSDPGRIEELDSDACLRLLAAKQVGRIAVSLPADSPLVVPVNYALSGDTLLFRSGFGSQLRALGSRPVSFEVDHHDPSTRTEWSVLVRGRAREVRERDVDPPLPEPWVPDDKPHLVQLRIRSVTGRRISRPSPESPTALASPTAAAHRETTDRRRLTVPPHCDSLDGPVVQAALRALDADNVDLVRPYVHESGEAELRQAFDLSRKARAQGPEAREVADRYFFETAVRIHRTGEGAAYTGLKPAGLDVGPVFPSRRKRSPLATRRRSPICWPRRSTMRPSVGSAR